MFMSESLCPSEPWQRQPGEPNLWYTRFEHYRLSGPGRSLLGTVNAERTAQGKAKQIKVPGAWNQACRQWCWRQRSEAWDAQQRHKAWEAQVREVADMNSRHIQEAQALQNKALQRLKALDLNDLSATDVLRYFVEATKLERTARGQPETIEEQRLTGKDGDAVRFSLEDALLAEKELQEWKNDRMHAAGSNALSEGNPQVL
jgi:hypothetical protein